MRRRDLLFASCGVMACASLPKPSARLPESGPSERACDHDLCKYWRASAQTQPAADFKVGRCSVGLPEDL